MKFNKKERRAHRESRGHDSLHVDPDLFFGDPGDPGRQKPDYKNLALCKQVFRTLSCVLSGECGDPALQDLTVEAVLPAPNAGRLMVVLRAGHVSSQMTTAEVLTRLEQVHGMLRSRVAEAIVRKRAPELTFQVFRQEVLP